MFTTPAIEENRRSLLRKWHTRFAHANMNLVKQMAREEIIDGMKLRKKDF